jgi:hypothetical protein
MSSIGSTIQRVVSKALLARRVEDLHQIKDRAGLLDDPKRGCTRAAGSGRIGSDQD